MPSSFSEIVNMTKKFVKWKNFPVLKKKAQFNDLTRFFFFVYGRKYQMSMEMVKSNIVHKVYNLQFYGFTISGRF